MGILIISIFKYFSLSLLNFFSFLQLPINVAVTGVRFNCICPTKVQTDFLKSINPDKVYHAKLHQQNIENTSYLT